MLGLTPQASTNIFTPSSGLALFANSGSNQLSWRTSVGYVNILDGSSNTTDRTYILPNMSGNIPLLEKTNSWSGSNYFSGSETILRSAKQVSPDVQRYESTVVFKPDYVDFYLTYNESIMVAPKSNTFRVSPIDTQSSQPIRYVGSSQVTIGTTTSNPSVLLELSSTTEGLLLSRLTTTQINAISSPIAGLVVYNTTLSTICFYNGSGWRKVSDSSM
jgi:hypothetical protein